MKKLSNTEAELKEVLVVKKCVVGKGILCRLTTYNVRRNISSDKSFLLKAGVCALLKIKRFSI